MSIPLTPIDLSAAGVGSTGTVSLANIQPSASPARVTNPAKLWFYNESGCGLLLTWGQSNKGFRLPAGAWKWVPVVGGETIINFVVEYVIPNATVTKLLGEYYEPNETMPDIVLGNSPVGGGTVSTAFQARELVTNDVTEAIFPDNTSFANQITIIPIFVPSGTGVINMGAAALNGANDFLIWSSDVLNNLMKIAMHLQFAIGTLAIGGMQVYSGNGPATLTHGLGIVPQIVIVSPTNSAQAAGAGSYTTTTVGIFIASGQSWKVIVIV